MAKTSQIARNRKRKRMAENQKAVRAELRKKAIDPNLSEEEREQKVNEILALFDWENGRAR